MDEMNWTLPPGLDEALTDFYNTPEPSPAFALHLERELARRQNQLLQVESPKETNLWSRVVSRLTQKDTAHMNPRLKLAWTIVLVLLVLVAITGVAYAVGSMLGYIPGVGIIDQSAPLRVLAEPVTVTRDGVAITITKALLSADKTVLFVSVTGVPMSAYPTDESNPGCMGATKLSLANGTLLEGGPVGAGGWTHFENRLEYGPIPARVNAAVLKFNCLGSTLPGALPENWEIPLRFAPAPPDMTVAPVIELSTPVVTDMPTDNTTNVPTAGATSTPVLSNTMTLDGITFTLEKFVEVEGGYQLYGSLDLSKASLPAQHYLEGMLRVTLTDAEGNRIPLEEVQPDQGQNNVFDPNKVAWIYRTNQKAFAGPLVLSLSSVTLHFMLQTPFELDLGAAPQIGQTWEINRDFTFDGHTIKLLSAQLLKSDDPQWASLLKFTYDDQGSGIFINLMDAVPQKALIEVAGGGGGVGGSLSGINSAAMYYGEIPAGLRRFSVNANGSHLVSGPWQVVWNPPATSDPIPTPAPAACLTSEKWEQVKGQPALLPAGLSGKILLTTEAVMPPDTNIFIANLDGSDRHGLVAGYYPALSLDGAHLVFVSDNVSLKILDLNNGQTVLLASGTTPIWSPDGSRIVFQGSDGLSVANADGTGLKTIKIDSPRVEPVGWLPDNQTIVFGAQVGDVYNLYEHVFKTYNLQTGETKTLFPVTIKTPIGAISPDGQWIAFNARVFGSNLDGAVFISRLDGSDRKLVAALDDTLAFHPIWSPDGKWLIVNIPQIDKPVSPVLVNPFTCQLAQLNNVSDTVDAWIP